MFTMPAFDVVAASATWMPLNAVTLAVPLPVKPGTYRGNSKRVPGAYSGRRASLTPGGSVPRRTIPLSIAMSESKR
jgi:hypothetical protein